MGLFRDDKKLCSVCGSPTPRLRTMTIQGMPICRECGRKLDLPDGQAEWASLEAMRRYIAFYDENQLLRDLFTETDRYDFPFLGDDIVVDSVHRLLRMKGSDDGVVFKAYSLRGFQIWEDQELLFAGSREALRCFDSEVLDMACTMQVEVDRFNRRRREYEEIEQLYYGLERRGENKGDPISVQPHIPEPRFEVPAPISRFCMEITVDHPYWPGYRREWNAPAFDPNSPSIRDYLDEYREVAGELYALSRGLMTLLDPDAPEVRERRPQNTL